MADKTSVGVQVVNGLPYTAKRIIGNGEDFADIAKGVNLQVETLKGYLQNVDEQV